MRVKLLGFLCVILVLDGVLSAQIPKVKTKPDEEDVYGELDDADRDPSIQKDQDYYDGDVEEPAPEEGSDNEVDVKLISKPETFIQTISSVVVLPCQASSSDAVRVWTKNGELIFQGTINIHERKNLKIFSNGSLEVSIQNEEDFGKYVCRLMISDNLKPEIVHEIVKKSSPTIIALYANDNRTKVLNVDDTLTLTCQATGYPKPKITWHKSNERLGTEGETLTIQNVKAKDAGSYRCLADNNVGMPDHKHIEIHINQSPIVSIEKYIVNSDHESDVELICEVKAYPVPIVNWQRDGINLVTKEPKIKLSRHNERNILIIKDMKEEDFGKYSCIARNSLGKDAKDVTLVKTPAIKIFEKAANASTREVILQWRVESKQNISMHEVQYRKKGEQSWKTITPEVTEGENDVYVIKHTLKSLEPGVYETRARSKNNHGWSDYSDIMPFEGAKHGSHHQKAKHAKKEQKELKTSDPTHNTPAQQRSEEISAVGESKPSSSTLPQASIFLISLALFASYFHIKQ